MKRAALVVVLALCASVLLCPATALAINGALLVERWTGTGSQSVSDPDTHINYTHFYFRRELLKLGTDGSVVLQANYGIHDFKWAPGQPNDDSYAITQRQLVNGLFIAVQFNLDTDPDKARFSKNSGPITLDSASDPYAWVAVAVAPSSPTLSVDAAWNLLQSAYNASGGNFNSLSQALTGWLFNNFTGLSANDQLQFPLRASAHGLLATNLREIEATLRAAGFPFDLARLLPADGVDLAITGSPNCSVNGSAISLNGVNLKNNRPTQSGPVKLDLYAFRAPYRGGALGNNATLLGTVNLPDRLDPGASLTGASFNTTTLATLPDATYFTALLVSDGAGRTDHYSFRDTLQVGPVTGSSPGEQNMPTQLINLSTRLRVETGEGVAIAGFVIAGSQPKRVIIRALGPSLLARAVTGALSATTLELYNSTNPQPIATNTGWTTSADAPAITSSGLQPNDARESAIIQTLAPGAYTAIVRGPGGENGITLVEMYDLDRSNYNVRPINVSTRGRVLGGDNVMIGGFVIGGNRPRRVVVRALGPSLAARGISQFLAQTQIALYDGAGGEMQSNQGWRSSEQAAAITASGHQPADDRESAILVTLAPGAYTTIVRGAGGTTGVGLVEVYDME